MYAIVRTGGKQYRVQPGDVIQVDKLEQALGAEFDMTDVLMIGGDSQVVGSPTVKNAKVSVVVTKQARDKKILVFKKKRRQGYRKMQGHRQYFTELFIKSITTPDGKTAKAETEANVVDVVQRREERREDRRAAKASTEAPSETTTKKTKTSVKKVAKKATAKKAAPKKTAKKVAAKKVTKKKTTKK